MKHILTTLAIAACACAAPLAQAQTEPKWELLHSDQDGRNFFDPANVVRDGDRIVVSARAEAITPQNGVTVMEARIVLVCPTRQAGFLSAKTFDKSGAVVAQREEAMADVEFAPADAGSFEAAALDRLCKPR